MPKYHYSDGSGNLYVIEANQLRYDPVTMLNSSSGVYDGGDPQTIKLSEEQVASVAAIFEQSFSNRTFKVEKRTLGSGEVRIISDDPEAETRKVILAMRSPDKQKLEEWLTGVLKESA